MSGNADQPTPLLTLPDDLRVELKDPMGPVEPDPDALVSEVTGALITVGDVVTYHLEQAGRIPDVSLIDERTKRQPVDEEIGESLDPADHRVGNPAGTLTEELLTTLRTAIEADVSTRIRVDGEEDLATIPSIIAAPDGTSVVYGQPDEGMVHVRVSPETRARARSLLERMDGDHRAAISILLD